MFEYIKSLKPYFFSLREIEGNVSLDMKIPLNWNYEEIVKVYRILSVKIQDKNDKYTLLSLISKSTQNGYDVAFVCANEIIKINKEEEEKQRLFQEKVKELQELFKKQSLDKLKDINLLNLDGQEDTTSVGLVEEGSGKGFEGSGDTQETTD